MKTACTEGQVQVLKLLAGTVTELNSMLLITHNMASIEKELQADSTHTTSLESLVGVSYYLYYIDPTMVMSVIVRSTQEYPKATLKLLKKFCKQSHHEEHFVLTGVALVFIPIQWVANAHLTHIKLSNNLLVSVPEELFQISYLQSLNLCQNCLEGIPSVLKWNCPKLKELDVSHNRMVMKPYVILEGKRKREQKIDSNPPSKGTQRDVINAAQSLLNLTGYNLYPCLGSITKVSISHNPALTQVSASITSPLLSIMYLCTVEPLCCSNSLKFV